jgi:hypothetical protein
MKPSRFSAAAAAVMAALLLPAAPCAAGLAPGCELVELKGVPVLRLSGTPHERGYAHGYLLAGEIMDLFNRYMAFVIRDTGGYETRIRPEVRDRFAFSPEIREEIAGLLQGLKDKRGSDRIDTPFGRPLDELDLLAVQALPDWYPFACSAFVTWGALAPDGPVAGRNMDFFVHPVLLENHMLVVNGRSPGARAHVSLTWPGMVGVLTGLNEDGVVAFVLDAAPKMSTDRKGFVARTLATRLVVERASRIAPAGYAYHLLRDVPTRWGGCLFVAGPRAGAVPGSAGVLERDARGTSLRTFGDDPVAEGVPAFTCTNHFRVRARPSACNRYELLSRALSDAARDGTPVTFENAMAMLLAARQQITLQSMVVNLVTGDVALRLTRASTPITSAETVRFTAEELFGAVAGSE